MRGSSWWNRPVCSPGPLTWRTELVESLTPRKHTRPKPHPTAALGSMLSLFIAESLPRLLVSPPRWHQFTDLPPIMWHASVGMASLTTMPNEWMSMRINALCKPLARDASRKGGPTREPRSGGLKGSQLRTKTFSSGGWPRGEEIEDPPCARDHGAPAMAVGRVSWPGARCTRRRHRGVRGRGPRQSRLWLRGSITWVRALAISPSARHLAFRGLPSAPPTASECPIRAGAEGLNETQSLGLIPEATSLAFRQCFRRRVAG